MGAIFAAHHLLLEQEVAIKVLRHGAMDEKSLARFMNEARAAARIQSEHVARIFDVGSLESGAPFIVMELLSGTDLEQLLALRTRIDAREAAGYVLEAIDALAQAHALGIVHRDLKPANLFLSDRPGTSPILKVLDFGISKNAIFAEPLSSLTTNDSLLGTPSYMAPEQFRTPKDVDARADIWALGVILYELVSGERPFKAPTLGEFLVALLAQERAPSLKTKNPDASDALDAIVSRCLAIAPAFRFDDVAALATALAEIAPEHSAIATRARATLSTAPSAARQPSSPAPPSGTPPPGQTADDAAPPAMRALPPATGGRTKWRVALASALGALAIVGTSVFALRASRKPAEARVVSAPVKECTTSRACAEGRVCRSDGKCVALASEECSVLSDPGAPEDDRTLWLGAMLPLTGPLAADIGIPRKQSLELARRDFTRIAHGLPLPSAEAGARPLGIIVCDDNAEPERAARHLVEDLHVAAVVGFRSSKEAMDLASSIFLPSRTLAMSALNTSPLVTTIPHPRGIPRLVWRTALSSARTSDVVALLVSQILEPQIQKTKRARAGGAALSPLRVALLRPDTTAGLGFFDALFGKLRFNGRSAMENAADFRAFVLGDPAGSEGRPRDADVVAGVLRFRPDVIVYVGQDEITRTVLAPIEDAWGSEGARPLYVAGNSLEGQAFFEFIGARAERRRRFFGVAAPSTSIANVKFTMHYNEEYSSHVSIDASPASAYDAFYVLAYAAYAVGDRPVTGVALAEAIARLVPPGKRIEVGPYQIYDAFETLRGGGNIDLEGAGSTLDFELASGDTTSDYVVLCVEADAKGRATGTKESGLVYDAHTRALTGAMRCR